MDYGVAMLLGKVSFVAVWVLTGYYCLRTALMYCVKNSLFSNLKDGLLQLVPVARKSHPYIGLSLLLFLPYHAYVMLSIYTVTFKVLTGILSISAIGIMLVLGVVLWRDVSNLRIRKSHRWFMYIALSTALLHAMVR